MDVVGAVTAGAAGLAAVLAGVNLYLSGRRELGKWKRETLVETLAQFLDASFTHGGVCHAILLNAPPEPELYRLRKAEIAAHDAETAALTRLRLLAPADVVDAARSLLELEWELANSCFADPPRISDEANVSPPIRDARREFLKFARAALSLDETTGTGSFDSEHTWRTFRIRVDQYENTVDNEPA